MANDTGMKKLPIIRKMKSLFMKWRLHGIVGPFNGAMLNAVYMSKLSKWRNSTTVTGFNDWYQTDWDYNRRINLYEAVTRQEQLADSAIDYFEFGVCGGHSFKWWLERNLHADSRFAKGSMAVALESLAIHDPRASFYKGLFQDTLIPFLDQYKAGRKKLIHMDADIFSATLFSLSQLHRVLNDGDVILFDEFAVPTHEFMAFNIFTESFYVNYEVIAAANNYLFLAVKIKK
jgi:O-methyltransferase